MNGLLGILRLKTRGLVVSEEGQDLVEYSLLVLLICLCSLVAVPPLASTLAPLLTSVTADL
jgi:hypothetical protein